MLFDITENIRNTVILCVQIMEALLGTKFPNTVNVANIRNTVKNIPNTVKKNSLANIPNTVKNIPSKYS